MMNIKAEFKDFKPTLKWLNKIKNGTGDARPLWIAMTPKLREFIANEFSGANPARWLALTAKYRHQKAKQGFPHWIGVRTGAMRIAANQRAKIKYSPKVLEWKLDTSMTPTKSGIPYALYFNQARPIYRSVRDRVNAFLRTDIKDMAGGSKAAFTFAWLEKALRQ